ncbi:MAG: MATE family efflux transporter [Dehalococcoidales bacterium]|nr:MAG: MATE family efflux transporter [Dehalococcoidales bacterium]
MEPEKLGELQETTERLGTERLGKLLLRLSTPSVISMMTISLYHLADTFWLGQVSYQAIAAVTVTFPFYVLVISIGVGTGVGANALASRRFGERNIEATNQVAGQVFLLTAVFGVLFVLTSTIFARPIAGLLGAGEDITDMVADYLFFFGWGTPFILFRLITRNVFQASGDAVKPMIFTIVGAVANAALDPFLIFGWGPFPEMGVGGAGLATAISSGLGALLSFYYLVGRKTVYRLKLHHLKPDFSVIAQIYRVGLPSILMQLTETIIFTLFIRIVGEFGSVAQAALGVAIRISDFAFMPIIGVGHGLLPIVGYCFGARLWERLWAAVRLASLGLAVMLGVATVFLEIFTPQLISIFNDDPELLGIAVPGMRIFLSTMILIGPAIMFITTFQGLSKGWTAIVLSLARQLVFFIPALYILPDFMGLDGVWLSIPISDGCGAIVAGLWLYREYRHQKRSGIWEALPVVETVPESVPRGRATLD